MKLINLKKNRKERGFTLVETLVAIMIFSAGVMAVMVVLSSGITSVDNMKKKMTAEYLAQEGVEFTRNMRDSEVITSINAGSGATQGWGQFVSALQTCGGNQTSGSFDISCLNGTQNTLDPNDVIYGNTTSRTISYTVYSGNEVKITSTVGWTQQSGPHTVSFSEILYNWAQ